LESLPDFLEEDDGIVEEQATRLLKSKRTRSPNFKLDTNCNDRDDIDGSARPPPVVIDNGSCFIKAGAPDDPSPACFLENVIGMTPDGQFLDYIGGGTQEFLGMEDSVQSMHRGVVSDWDIMARTWDNVVNRELVDNNTGSVAGVHRPFPDVLLTHGLREAPQDREVACEILFEVVGVNSTASVSATRAALTHAGRTTGVAVDCGDGSIQVEAFTNAPRDGAEETGFRAAYGGRDLTGRIHHFIRFEKGVTRLGPNQLTAIARELKEAQCAVALPHELRQRRAKATSVKLPDGKVIDVPTDVLEDIAETMFDPLPKMGETCASGNSLTLPGLVMAAVNEAQAGDSYLLDDVVLTGGGSMLKNLPCRLEAELKTRVPHNASGAPGGVNLVLSEDRDIGVWRGAAIIAARGVDSWMKRVTYDEYGPSAMHRTLEQI